jgi:hypothetical protein
MATSPCAEFALWAYAINPSPQQSPWQNGFAERLIGSIRRECVDHIVVWGEGHLRWILRAYARYYNDIRRHRSLDKDAPPFVPFNGLGTSRHKRSSVSFIIATFGFRFSVHTTGAVKQGWGMCQHYSTWHEF